MNFFCIPFFTFMAFLDFDYSMFWWIVEASFKNNVESVEI